MVVECARVARGGALFGFVIGVGCNLIVQSDYAFRELPAAARDAGNDGSVSVDGSPDATGAADAADAADAPARCQTPGSWTHELLRQECGTSIASDPCLECEQEKCCQSLDDCMDEPDCEGYRACVDACPNEFLRLEDAEACRLQCSVEFPRGQELSQRRVQCRGIRCSVECLGGDACDECTQAACGDVNVACYIDPSCMAFGTCFYLCPEASEESCLQYCKLRHPSADMNLFKAYLECLGGTGNCCDAICG
jgi:hypothetical protein